MGEPLHRTAPPTIALWALRFSINSAVKGLLKRSLLCYGLNRNWDDGRRGGLRIFVRPVIIKGRIGLVLIVQGSNPEGLQQLGFMLTPLKLALKQFGVTDLLNPSNFDKPIQEVIKEMTKGGVNSTYECIGRVELMLATLQCAHPVWGRAVILGTDDIDKKICFSPLELHDGRKLKLAPFGGFKISDVPKLVDRFMNTEFDLDKFVTQRMTDINSAFQLLLEGKCLKCVLKMQEDYNLERQKYVGHMEGI